MNLKMKRNITIAAVVILLSFIGISLSYASNDKKYSLTAPNGLSFGQIRGYENWQLIASNYRTDNAELRFILGNDIVIDAYKKGSGMDGKPFPEGSILVKIGYSMKENQAFKSSMEPNVLQRVEYIIKDSNRFKDTGGWGFARFVYDSNTSTFAPYGQNESFSKECFACHILVEKRDFVFTHYTER